VLQREPNVVQPFEQAVLAEGVDLEWDRPAAVAGEVEDSHWRELERWSPRQDEHALTCDVSPQRVLNILVLAEEKALQFMYVFQNRLEEIRHRRVLNFEKFLGDGALYSSRRAIRVLAAADPG